MPVLKVHDGTQFVQVPTGTLDAANVSYTPADVTDWDGDVDPGDLDDALDQLADKRVTGAGSSTDNAITRWDGATGKLIQDSSVILADSGALSEVFTITGKSANALAIQPALGSAIACRIFGGGGTATANGGLMQVAGGAGGLTSGDGGEVKILGGDVTDGDGGKVTITAAAGVGTNKDGGNVNVTAGAATGSGTEGTVVLVSTTVFNEAGSDKDFRMESDGDANNFVSDGGTNRIGIGMLSPNEKLQVADAIALSNNTEGNTGRLTRRTSHETHTLAAASTSDTTTISIPSGARLLGVSMNVNVEIAAGGLSKWNAAFITGSTTSIATSALKAVNTKVDFIVPDDEKTSAVTEIRFTAVLGSFSAGVIEVVAYYEELTSLADV